MNPYHKFLELPESETAPDHYGLLGVPRFTEDAEQIHAALVTRNSQLRGWDNSKFYLEANALLDEVVAASFILEDPIKKAAYDAELRQRLGLSESKPVSLAALVKFIDTPTATEVFDYEVFREPDEEPLPKLSVRFLKTPAAIRTPRDAEPTAAEAEAPATDFDSLFLKLGGVLIAVMLLIAVPVVIWTRRKPESPAPIAGTSAMEDEALKTAPVDPEPPPRLLAGEFAIGGFDAGTKAGDRQVITIEGVVFPFRYCPPGTFQMGPDDENQVEVTFTQGFGMLETEVTQAMYFPVMKKRPWQGKAYVKEGSNYPVVFVNWNNASDYCQKLTAAGRLEGVLTAKEKIALPTEAQWEYAARAGTATAYFFGSDAKKLGEHAWYEGNAWSIGEKYAHLVGQKEPNPWGLLDQSGNVWEWCDDNYAGKLPGGTNPRGPSAGSSRVLRGGSFYGTSIFCRVGDRNDLDPAFVSDFIGFRVVVSVE